MTKRLQVYKCEKCGNIVEILHEGVGQLVCCNEPMKLMEENTVDAAKEKHVPVIEKTAGGILVRVGSVPHPMEEKHYIELIELHAQGQILRQYLEPGSTPEVLFKVTVDNPVARAYCNLHGLWKSI